MHIKSPVKQCGSSSQTAEARWDNQCIKYINSNEVAELSLWELRSLLQDQEELSLEIHIKELVVQPAAFDLVKDKLLGVTISADKITLRKHACSSLNKGEILLQSGSFQMEDAAFMMAEGVEKITLEGHFEEGIQYQELFQGCLSLKHLNLEKATAFDCVISSLDRCDQLESIAYPSHWSEEKKAPFEALISKNRKSLGTNPLYDLDSEMGESNAVDFKVGVEDKSIKRSQEEKDNGHEIEKRKNRPFLVPYDLLRRSGMGLMGLSLCFLLSSCAVYALSQLMLMFFSLELALMLIAVSAGIMSAFVLGYHQSCILSKVNQICVQSESIFNQSSMGTADQNRVKKEENTLKNKVMLRK
jgi:hypothetical protein